MKDSEPAETPKREPSMTTGDAAPRTMFTDLLPIEKVRRTQDGYLAADARVARTGVQIYKGSELGRPDLGDVAVYRPEAEVFKDAALRSFAHRPVTYTHPREPVTSSNWRKYSIGHTGDEVVRDGSFIRVPMLVMDQACIDAYEKEGVKELSMGYSTELKWEKGTTESGEHYDAVQTDIRANHLALVPVARGGKDLRIGDEARGTDIEWLKAQERPAKSKSTKVHKGDSKVTKLTIDGVPLDISGLDETAQGFLSAHLQKWNDERSRTQKLLDSPKKLKRLLDKAKDKNKDPNEDCDDDEDMNDAVASLKKTVDAKDGEIVVLKKQIEDAKVTPEMLDALVAKRSDVVGRASKLLDKTFKYDGQTLEFIRRASVAAKLGDAVARDMSDAAIDGAFMALTTGESRPAASGRTAPLAQALSAANAATETIQDGASVRDQAFAELEKRSSTAWRGTNRTGFAQQ